MTSSPATTRGPAPRFRCRACDRQLTAGQAVLEHCRDVYAARPAICRGVLEPVSGDQLVAGGAGGSDRVTGKVAAVACGLSESHLSTALGDRASDRYLRDEHIDAILILATDAERLTYWTARMGWCGYAAGPKHVRSAEERLAALEYRVAVALGAAGADVVEQERSRP